ncbi:MAG: helix-hairpin-helix domain-containing protein [Myxococcota bacterium]|nr:helix-hairpin-helix domain-containing protein [Myxococcota bacterium]
MSEARARAALGLAGLLTLVAAAEALPPRGEEPRPCRDPRRVPEGAPGPPAVACSAPGRPPLAGAARLLFGLPLDLNRAPARALEALPGIGARRAEAIVQARPWCEVGELRRIRGIGAVTLARLAPLVRADCPEG